MKLRISGSSRVPVDLAVQTLQVLRADPQPSVQRGTRARTSGSSVVHAQ
jgi:hypothetical protein